MKRFLTAAIGGIAIIITVASCKVYSEKCDKIYENDTVIYDANTDYNHNGYRGNDDNSDDAKIAWGKMHGLTDCAINKDTNGDGVADAVDGLITIEDFNTALAAGALKNRSGNPWKDSSGNNIYASDEITWTIEYGTITWDLAR